MPVVVALRARRVQLGVGRSAAGLLEEDIGADIDFLQIAVFINSDGGESDIHPTDGADSVCFYIRLSIY